MGAKPLQNVAELIVTPVYRRGMFWPQVHTCLRVLTPLYPAPKKMTSCPYLYHGEKFSTV